MFINEKARKQKKAKNSIYLKISPSTITYKKLMEKARDEGVEWQEIARTILKKALLNL